MTFMQLPLFDKEPDACDDDFDKWIYVLKNMETLTRLPWKAKSAVLQRLEQIADVASLTKAERLKYDEGLRKYRDTLSVLEGAKQDGLAEGAKEEKQETAKRMLAMGINTDVIAAATGLTKDEVDHCR